MSIDRFIISERAFQRVGRWLGLAGVAGFVCLVVIVATRGAGVLTAVGLTFLMASVGMVNRYRKEPGLWMLYALVGACGLMMTGLKMYGLGVDILRQRGRADVEFDDLGLQALFAASTWVLLSAAVWNWRRFRRPPQAPPRRPPEPTPVPSPIGPPRPSLSAAARAPVSSVY